MANFGNMVFTQQGLALYSKAQTGVQLNFTRMQIGSGQLAAGQDQTQLTALISPIAYFAINSVISSANVATVKGVYQNSGVAAATYACELGLYATDPTLGEILFAYVNAGAQGNTIPPVSAGLLSQMYQIDVAIGNASSVTATIPANTYIPTTEKGSAGGVASLGADLKVPIAQLPSAATMGAIPAGTDNSSVSLFSALLLNNDTRSVSITKDAKGRLSTATYTDPSKNNTVVSTITLNYNADGTLNSVVEVAGGRTITETIVYSGGAFAGTTKTVV